MHFEAYCDGSCSGNPGPGAAAALLLAFDGDTLVRERELLSAVDPFTTNQKQELKAAALALSALTRSGVDLTLYSDSRYVVLGMTEWIASWKARDWLAKDKKPVKNRELWEELDRLAAPHRINWQWVKGHAQNPYNNRVDALATRAVCGYLEKRGGGQLQSG